MADRAQIEEQLRAKQAEAEGAAGALAAERQRLRGLQRAVDQLGRRLDSDDPVDRKQRADLETDVATSRARIDELKAARDRAAGLAGDLRDQLAPLIDPRDAVGSMDARFPVLLFPVRLETRFVTTGTQQQKDELLVRIYPDDCLVDGFEADRSAAEVANLRRYWCGVWKAGGDEPLLRAAWRELCSAHGAGRALYLVRGDYRPLATSDPRPVRGPGTGIILVIPVEAPIATVPERKAITDYWTAIWRGGPPDAFDQLQQAVGAARAEEIRAGVVPFNRQERPQAGVDPATVPVSVLFVVLPPAAAAAAKGQSWTRAPVAALLPERFLLIGDTGPEHIELLGNMVRQPLVVGPDPLADGADQFGRQGGDLTVPAALRWMTDFDEALAAGMAFRVQLTPAQKRMGFDRLYVLGVRASSDPERARGELETLITHQTHSGSGFAIVPQGAPTNNTDQGSSAWSRVQEADDLFAVAQAAQADLTTFDAGASAPLDKRDGLVLAEALGIDPAVLQHVPNADATDQAEARAMNAALWPATLGYFMDTQMRPVFSDDVIERTRRHFIDRVSGRGVVPAVRVSQQPYGILPTTAFSRLQFGKDPFLNGLLGLVHKLEETWNVFADAAQSVTRPGDDPQRTLLDVLGLNPSAVEFQTELVDGADMIWNSSYFSFGGGLLISTPMMDQMSIVRDLLRTFGYSGDDPEIFGKFFAEADGPMKRPVIDDAPLSEVQPLAACTSDGKNYLEWCRDRAERAFDELRRQVGFVDGRLPNALLFHLARHALQLGYHGAAIKLHVAAGLIPVADAPAAYREPAFIHVHVADSRSTSESRYHVLYDSPGAITGGSKTVADFIPSLLAEDGAANVLAEQLAGLRVLEKAPTARLERALAEHLDLGSHRWDAWALGLVNERLAYLRRRQADLGYARRGLYLGAFGWVEDLRPDPGVLTKVTPPADVAAVFDDPARPLLHDRTNGGHLLAPSLNHAVTAAVLRNGYLSNATPTNPDLLAVNLTSARVRVARQFIEGVRNGQPLGALLGYQLERRLHDRYADAELDDLIFEVRRAFPLVAKRIAGTVDGAAAGAPIDAIEARNVCDGLALVEYVRTSTVKTYPWGKDLRRVDAAKEALLNQEVDGLFDIHDAMADLAIAESVHQATTGNADRAAAVTDAYAKAGIPPEPDVVRTPRSGVTLTHRMALHLSDTAPGGTTPRATAEPALDAWVGGLLPPLGDLVVRVRYTNSTPGAPQVIDDVSMQALGLSPIDVLHLADAGDEPAMNELDDRLIRHVVATKQLCPDAVVTLHYTEPVGGRKTVFESGPLIAGLRALVLESRPLRPSDAALQNEGSGQTDAAGAIPLARLTAARTTVAGVRGDAAALAATLAPLVLPAADFDDVVAAVDAAADAFVALQGQASLCGSALSASGLVLRGIREWFALVRGKARRVVTFWDGKLAECDARRADAADAAQTGSFRMDALARAERAVSASYTVPLPATLAAMLGIVNTKRADFMTVKDDVQAVADSAATKVADLWDSWKDTFDPRRLHDVTVIATDEEQTALRALVADMARQLQGLLAELDGRLDKADAAFTAGAAASGEARVAQLAEAAKALLGEGFRILPRFTLPAAQADEWQNAYDGRAALLAHLAPAHDFPVDDWLYGVARVRPKAHHLEKLIQLAVAFGRPEPELAPLQFPFRSGEPWLAMELPAAFDLAAAGEHLLYTAIYPTGGFDKTAAAQVGLLLDEWSETVPVTRETAGLAFHFDRPSNEPPQAWLLVVPASAGEQWTFDDLRDAIPETFALARKRLAEPRDVAGTTLSRLLPATLMASTADPISIGSRMRAFDTQFAAKMVFRE